MANLTDYQNDLRKIERNIAEIGSPSDTDRATRRAYGLYQHAALTGRLDEFTAAEAAIAEAFDQVGSWPGSLPCESKSGYEIPSSTGRQARSGDGSRPHREFCWAHCMGRHPSAGRSVSAGEADVRSADCGKSHLGQSGAARLLGVEDSEESRTPRSFIRKLKKRSPQRRCGDMPGYSCKRVYFI